MYFNFFDFFEILSEVIDYGKSQIPNIDDSSHLPKITTRTSLQSPEIF